MLLSRNKLASHGVMFIKLLTSFDGWDIHQESWSWVGSRGWDAVSRTEGRQSRVMFTNFEN